MRFISVSITLAANVKRRHHNVHLTFPKRVEEFQMESSIFFEKRRICSENRRIPSRIRRIFIKNEELDMEFVDFGSEFVEFGMEIFELKFEWEIQESPSNNPGAAGNSSEPAV